MDSTLYNIMLVIHIVAVALWLGANVFMGLGSGRAVGASAEVNAWWVDLQGFVARVVKHAAFALLFVTGIAMLFAARVNGEFTIGFGAPFVSLGFFTIIVGGALGGMVFLPGTRKAAEAFRKGDTAGAKAQTDKMGMVGAAESVLVVVTILFMVFQWGGLGN